MKNQIFGVFVFVIVLIQYLTCLHVPMEGDKNQGKILTQPFTGTNPNQLRTNPPRFPQLKSKSNVTVDVVYDMIGRVLGESYKSLFVLTLKSMSAPISETGQELDTFVLQSSNQGEPITISGNSPVALSMGVMYYLKKYAHLSMNWGYQNEDSSWSCDNMYLPLPVPGVSVTETIQSPYPFRYYMNVCTVSYSMAWWDWARWEREIDWMALSGINFPLAFTGQEYIWAKVFADLGVNETQIETFFSGPAFLAWQRMGNIKGWGGPLLPSWRSQQADLQKQIVARMRAFGMIPVMSAFAGHIPDALVTLFPNANVTKSAAWHFNEPYSQVYLLSPFDPLFTQIGTSFLKAQSEEFGFGEHIYQCDTFNEMDPSSSDPTYLKSYSAAVYNAMYEFDPQAVWLMQGWLFHSSFWTDKAISAYLSGVESNQLIILDLNSEQQPLWTTFVANNKSFIWCLLHDYGGQRDLHGNIHLISTDPISAKASAGALMVGTGTTMEAIEQNHIVYELMNEMGYRSENFNSTEWVLDYARRRYNGTSQSMINAWLDLIPAAYSRGFSWNANWIGVTHPDFGRFYDTTQNPTGILNGWRNFLNASNEYNFNSGGWHFDLVDISRQVISNFFWDVFLGFKQSSSKCLQVDETSHFFNTQNNDVPWDYCTQSALNYTNFMIQMTDDMEEILATDINYLLGYWIAAARAMGTTDQEKDILEFNARNQITLWGPTGNINDYAAKTWSGLVGSYYKKRWQLFYDMINTCMEKHNPNIDWTALTANGIAFSQAWGAQRDTYPTQPQGNASAIASSLELKYATFHQNYLIQQNTQPIPKSPTIFRTAWTKDPAQLSILCDLESSCIGFSTDGVLFQSGTPFQASNTINTYLKQ